ncbi:MAG TPA: hypothetical protein VI547_11515, partial [Anaerolineales bacterium]|nr:hypothetical protein [Anaerolineales bacterium]
MTTLSLFATSSAPHFALDGEWRLKAAHEGQGVELGYTDPSFDDSEWEVVRLPHLRHATAEQDTLWYRHAFATPTPNPSPIGEIADGGVQGGGRWLLHFGGAFYRTRVWLNG